MTFFVLCMFVVLVAALVMQCGSILIIHSDMDTGPQLIPA